MLKVSNKKIIRRLSYRTLKEKGMKNLIAVLAIMLTSIMFTSLFTVGMSLIDSIQESTMRQVGTRAHGGFKYMREKEYEAVRKAPGILDISYNIIVGFGDNPELYGIQTEVRYSEEKAAEWSFCKPDIGKMPEERLECATSTKVLDALSIPHEVGSRVPLRVRIGDKVIEETFTLSGIWEEEGTVFVEEFFVSRQWQQEYAPEQEISYNDNLLTGGSMEGYRDVSIMLPTTYDMEGRIHAIAVKAGLPADSAYPAVNWAYMTSNVDAATVLLGIILFLIIVLSGYLIIYNIFYINITSDIRYYGLLKTVGTTGKQLKAMVRGQAFFLSCIGILLGLFAGWLVGREILPFLYSILDTGGVENIVLHPGVFIGSALFSLLVVYISCIKPCRLAIKVSPIEAVRYVEQLQIKKKTKRAGKINMLRMAAANMGRSRKKAAVVILSLTLSMVILNSTYTIVTGFDFDKYTENYLVGDYLVRPTLYIDYAKHETNTDLVTDGMLSDIQRMPGAESAETIYKMDGKVYLSEECAKEFIRFTQENKEYIGDERFWKEEAEAAGEDGGQTGMLYGIPEELFKYLNVIDGAVDMDKLKTGKYALLIDNSRLEGKPHWVKTGDKVRLSKEGEEVEIMAKVSMPYGMGAHYGIGYFKTDLIMETEAFHSAAALDDDKAPDGGLHIIITAEEGKEEALGRKLSAYIDKNMEKFTLTSKESLREEFSSFTNVFTIVGGVLCLILGMIGILNFVNATITGILSRRQEFAVMESVGMTGVQLRNMLINEGLLYGLWTILLAATAGNIIGYALVKAVSAGMDYFVWQFTMAPILISIPFLLFLAVFIPYMCYYILCRKSIVERFRLSEV